MTTLFTITLPQAIDTPPLCPAQPPRVPPAPPCATPPVIVKSLTITVMLALEPLPIFSTPVFSVGEPERAV